MTKLQKSIDKAFERWKKGVELNVHTPTNPEMWNLNMIMVLHKLDCFEQIAEKTNFILSFFSDKVKAKFKLQGDEYIIDFFFNEEDGVLIGKMDKNKVYSLRELPYTKLKEFTKSLP